MCQARHFLRAILSSAGPIFLSAYTIVGCGSGPEIGAVEGRVMLDGQPLARAVVTFLPTAGGRPSIARTDSEGRYELQFDNVRKGAMLGTHEVRIRTYFPPSETLDDKGNIYSAPEQPERLPKRYHSPTELCVEVTSGVTTYDFDLQSH